MLDITANPTESPIERSDRRKRSLRWISRQLNDILNHSTLPNSAATKSVGSITEDHLGEELLEGSMSVHYETPFSRADD